MTSELTLKITSVNVNGLTEFKKRMAINKMINLNNSDIVLLQETHDHNQVNAFEFQRFKRVAGPTTRNQGGTAILISRKLNLIITDKAYSQTGNVTIIKGHIDETKLVISSLYASQKIETMREDISFLNKYIATQTEDHSIVIMTDRNYDPDKTDTNNKYKCYEEAFHSKAMLNEMRDILDPDTGIVPTRPITRPNRNGGNSIDTILVNDKCIESAYLSIKITGESFSDHCAIHLDLKKSTIDIGKAPWRISNTTIYDKNFNATVKTILGRDKPEQTNWTTHLDRVLEEIIKVAKKTQTAINKQPPRKTEALKAALSKIIQEINKNNETALENRCKYHHRKNK